MNKLKSLRLCVASLIFISSMVYATPIIDPLDVVTRQTFSIPDLGCLAKAIHHEAKGESTKGKIAVGHVVLNRTEDERFPSSICDVVKQKTKWVCQFSWVCDSGKWKQEPSQESKQIAYELLTSSVKDPTKGALFFHASTLETRFNRRRTAVIGNHIFYK